MQTEIAKVTLWKPKWPLRCPAVNTVLKQWQKITMYMFTFVIVQE